MIMKIIHGKVENVLPTLADSSVDCIVTDPPYELGFMGKKWDSSGIAYSVAMWAECLRVLKPGGHLLSFSGSRTYHRMTCAIEDAGFEVRDQIMWIYGSGFPKSMDVSKAIDKAAGVEFEAIPASGVGFMNAEGEGGYNVTKNQLILKGESTPEAIQWQGWGTALKPAHEPICVARKPLIGTVADNVLQYGTGAINIDACRVEVSPDDPNHRNTQPSKSGDKSMFNIGGVNYGQNPLGRFPANLIFDEEAGAILDEQAPSTGAAAAAVKKGHNGKSQGIYGDYAQKGDDGRTFRNDMGGASRFFYCAKASKADRGVGNDHPTVKPTTLMQYLAKLVCPPGGVLLDPFAGSGSTLKACELEGIKAVGIDMELHHVKIITSRVSTCVIVVDGIEMDRDTFEMLY